MKVRGFFPVTLIIDGEEIVLRIKRMNMEEHSQFTGRFARVGTPTHVRFVSREITGPEQEQNDKGEYVVPFEQIAVKRLEALTPEDRLKYEARVQEDEAEAKEFLSWICETFVTVERGLIEETADGKEQTVTEGIDFLRIFGARRDVIQQVLEAVQRENELDVNQKKTWRSPIASSHSSKGRRRARAGKKRRTIVKPAEIADSPSKEGATPSQNGRSGLTEATSSNPAPSSD